MLRKGFPMKSFVLSPTKLIPHHGCLFHWDQQREVSECPWPKKGDGAARLKTTTATEARFGWAGLQDIRYALIQKIRDYLGIFPNMGGIPNSQV